jgi:hypothetical protein
MVVFIVAAVVSVIGAAVWIGLLIWAAKGDGDEQRQHEQAMKRDDSDR